MRVAFLLCLLSSLAFADELKPRATFDCRPPFANLTGTGCTILSPDPPKSETQDELFERRLKNFDRDELQRRERIMERGRFRFRR